MTAAERAKCALELGKPDEIPTFELEFQLSPEFFGYELDDERLHEENLGKYSAKEIERFAYELADKYARVYGTGTAYDIGGAALSGDEEKDAQPGLDYSIIPIYSPGWDDPESPVTAAFRKRLREHFGNTRLFGGHGDGTYSIPNGSAMYEFAYRIADVPEEVKAEAARRAKNAIERNKRQREAGLDVILMCADYCYNSGPFMSPAMFDEFIIPYLAEIIAAARKDGLYTIKHTDGNIMPILSRLVECRPHALHSLDPMAGVDIREVKRLYGDRICLCGNVHCAAMQTGTDEDVRQSAEYCLKYGGENGGYIFATSNVPFRGMPPERYKLVLDIWKKMRRYE